MYKIEILDKSNNLLARVERLVSLDRAKNVIKFNDNLSGFGSCRFRVQTKDPIASRDLFEPYQNYIRIRKDNALVWVGVVVNNPIRRHEFIEVEGRTFAWLFTKVQVAHTATTPNWREVVTGTMAENLTTLFNEGKDRGHSPIGNFTLGTIQNPKFPWDTATDWTFSAAVSVRYEYASLFQVVNSFAGMANADWFVTKDRVFNFVTQAGRNRDDVSFRFGRGGNISDYNSPLDGTGMANDLWVASLEKAGSQIISRNFNDSSLFGRYGRLFGSSLFPDHLDINILSERGKRILELNKRPNTEISIILNEKALPFGTYDLGDYVNISIKDGPINVFEERRVVGWNVKIDETGIERVQLITNMRLI